MTPASESISLARESRTSCAIRAAARDRAQDARSSAGCGRCGCCRCRAPGSGKDCSVGVGGDQSLVEARVCAVAPLLIPERDELSLNQKGFQGDREVTQVSAWPRGQQRWLDPIRSTLASAWCAQSKKKACRATRQPVVSAKAPRQRSTAIAGMGRRTAWRPSRWVAADRRRSRASIEPACSSAAGSRSSVCAARRWTTGQCESWSKTRSSVTK